MEFQSLTHKVEMMIPVPQVAGGGRRALNYMIM